MRTLILSLAATALMAVACAPTDTATPAPAPDDEADQCKASQYQQYIGRNRSELPPEPAGATWRVTCTQCPVTMDFNPERLNIFYDEPSGVIRRVSCG
ncbi:I78 family peptidase inhibitor [Brevundimonas lenta]|uniref:Hemolysin n=1 Tax=Brevundimonas lenta TaxID=424796 RepID=A0A7W6JCT5_9CAUL|nr:I78 family peptidase inhibitor [Brevundimonas lenta]MBB4082732.1 hypothetical protein [Brevundimonas lenta]